MTASAIASSRRGYLSQAELETFADIVVTDPTEADDQISQAEEIIDGWVGFQQKFMPQKYEGRCSLGGGSTTLYLDSEQLDVFEIDYFKGCEIEIIGGTGVGQRRRITASTKEDGKITVQNAWDTNPDTSSFYSIYQLGKFPRPCDVRYYTQSTPYQYYKQIPEAVKRAVAAQVEYMIKMGADYFSSDKSHKQSETISKYSYTNAPGGSGLSAMIAPKAKILLQGIINRTGRIA